MSAAARKDPAAVETEVREKIHLEILKRTGAYHANDHILLPSGQHTTDYVEQRINDKARASIKPGKNVIAVQCNQTTGGQYIDVGLVRLVEKSK